MEITNKLLIVAVYWVICENIRENITAFLK